MGKRRMLEIVLAFLMLSLGMLMGWRALFDPAFLPQRGVLPESLTLEEFLKLRESISEEFQKLGARRDREYRRIAALLRRNPHAISKEHAEELQDLRNMME